MTELKKKASAAYAAASITIMAKPCFRFFSLTAEQDAVLYATEQK